MCHQVLHGLVSDARICQVDLLKLFQIAAQHENTLVSDIYTIGKVDFLQLRRFLGNYCQAAIGDWLHEAEIDFLQVRKHWQDLVQDIIFDARVSSCFMNKSL